MSKFKKKSFQKGVTRPLLNSSPIVAIHYKQLWFTSWKGKLLLVLANLSFVSRCRLTSTVAQLYWLTDDELFKLCLHIVKQIIRQTTTPKSSNRSFDKPQLLNRRTDHSTNHNSKIVKQIIRQTTTPKIVNSSDHFVKPQFKNCHSDHSTTFSSNKFSHSTFLVRSMLHLVVVKFRPS